MMPLHRTVHGDPVLDGRGAAFHLPRAILVAVAHKKAGRVGIVDDVEELLVGEPEVERRCAQAYLRGCEIDLEVLVGVFGKYRETVSLCDTQSEQGVRQPIHPFVELPIGQASAFKYGCSIVRKEDRRLSRDVTQGVHLSPPSLCPPSPRTAGQAQDLGRPWNCMSMLRLISLEMGEN